MTLPDITAAIVALFLDLLVPDFIVPPIVISAVVYLFYKLVNKGKTKNA